MAFKVVITEHRFPNLDAEKEVLSQVGAELVVGNAWTEQELIELAWDADGILNARAKITSHVIDSLQKCKVIVRYGIGTDTIDIPAATKRGIYVVNVPDYCIEEVSNHALAMLLCMCRKILEGDRLVRSGEWRLEPLKPMPRLEGQTLGIIGFGRIGRRLAAKAKPIGFEIVAFDPNVSQEEANAYGVSMVSLDELLAVSDYISIHAPLCNETRNLLGRPQFEKMKAGVSIINAARGEIIDEEALVEAIEKGIVSKVALDVLRREPPEANNPLLGLPQVILTPHVAWYSEQAISELQRKAAEEVARVLKGELPKHLVNPEVLRG
ncbi:MAG: C-terminal binding protein [Bacillota bacterium]